MQRPTTCVNCNHTFDSYGMEEATVGTLFGPQTHHVICPLCKKCAACGDLGKFDPKDLAPNPESRIEPSAD